jgi:hypothetical protein
MIRSCGLSHLHNVRFETRSYQHNSKFKFSVLVDEMKIIGFLINLGTHWSKWFKIWFLISILKIIFTPTSCPIFFIENASDAELTSVGTVVLHCVSSVKGSRDVVALYDLCHRLISSLCRLETKEQNNSVSLVRKRTIPTERPPLVTEVNANFCG